MKYRENRRAGISASVLGFGTSSICYTEREEAAKTLEMALSSGITYFDLATSESSTFELFGEVFKSARDKLFYQIHFGALYGPGKSYARANSLDEVKKSIEWQLEALGTDYIDFGFIHCIDTEKDWLSFVDNGILEWLKKLHKEGVAHHLGMSTHTPSMAEKIIGLDLIDQLMFSINPAYDYEHGEYARGASSERMNLYRLCAARGIGISVMKPFAGGKLLKAAESPFGQALTQVQCIQYDLDKPGVITVLPGIRDTSDLSQILAWQTATKEERDYSIISSITPKAMDGVCVYCNHCQPCPQGIDIGMANKLYDLARLGDKLAVEHYRKLDPGADNCVGCGHCNEHCPFHVDQVKRMHEIARYFANM